ncbi:hypothetical protein B296_00012402 [Ensete ventricosum]|uniref:Uncharacterized protein n=1 Tax=Ensete ventricosum TaxID=4639 RepID=A0A426ZNL7_ENSVE|nr:hypothetical protein B296_00012402 [Ensete ventricosum]
MWATSSLQYLTSHQLSIVGGAIHWSVAASALTCRLLPIGYCVCPDTLLVASCRGSEGLVWHVGSTAPPLCWGLDYGEKDCHEALDLLGCVARKSFSSGVVNLWRLAAVEGR